MDKDLLKYFKILEEAHYKHITCEENLREAVQVLEPLNAANKEVMRHWDIDHERVKELSLSNNQLMDENTDLEHKLDRGHKAICSADEKITALNKEIDLLRSITNKVTDILHAEEQSRSKQDLRRKNETEFLSLLRLVDSPDKEHSLILKVNRTGKNGAVNTSKSPRSCQSNVSLHIWQMRSFIKGESCSVCSKKMLFGDMAKKCLKCKAIGHSECLIKTNNPCIPIKISTP